MNNPKHTPGPWVPHLADPKSTGLHKNTYLIFHESSQRSKYVAQVPPSRGERETKDAQLIAAAPEMLEALERVKRYLERSGEASLLDTFGVNEAISKAKGDKQ